MDFFTRLDSLRERWNVLDHRFYVRWSQGELEREELSFYAAEYRHAVIALAEAVGAAARSADSRSSCRFFDPANGGVSLASATRARLAEHAAEEAQHIGLWDGFAAALGADLERAPRVETDSCRDSWTAGRNALEHLVAAFTVESGQPAIAQTKLEGLLGHYGFEEGPATEYFSVHAERDHEHAAELRELIEERLADADLDRLLEVAEGVLRGNWELLDGVERHAGRLDEPR